MLFFYIQILGVFVGSFLLSLLINSLSLFCLNKKGVAGKNDTNGRWSSVSKPSLGGISMFVSFVVVTTFLFFSSEEGENVFFNKEFLGLFIAGVLAFLMGAADDYYNTKPVLKLLIQILCGVIFVFTGNSVDLFHHSFSDGLVTIVWVVGVMNSLNMLDNMDGITTTVSLFILLTCATVLLLFGVGNSFVWVIIIIAQIGTLIGFLFYNIHPSRMFMGDSGSQFLALFVSFFGIKALWNLPATFKFPSWTSFFIVLVAFAPAAVDTLTVVINRKRRGVSIALGGKDHTTHHLVYKGYTDFKVWLIFGGISALSYLLAVQLAYLFMNGHYFYSIIGLLFFLCVFIPMFRNTIRYPAPDKEKSN